MRRKLAIISLTFFLASGLVGALTPQDKPLTKDQVMGLVRNRLGDESGAKVVEQRGIDFEPTDDFLSSLREAGAGDVFLKAVREAKQPAKNQPAASGPLDIYEITAMLLEGAPSQRLADLVRQRGITFLPSGELLQQLKDMGAEPALLDAIRNSPASAMYFPPSARFGTVRKHAAAAEQDCRARLSREPANVSARLLLVLALNPQGKYADALQALREGIRVRPDSAILHYHLAEELSNQFNPNTYDAQGTVAEYRDALRLDPKYAQAHFGLGLALERQGDLDGAIAELRQALALNPKDDVTRWNVGRLLEQKGDLDGAIAVNREALALDPKNALARFRLGNFLERKGDLDGAIAVYREAARLNPRNPESHIGLSLALLKHGDVDEALGEAREAVRLNPNYGRAHGALGSALFRRGDLDGALAECREGERLNPKDADAHYVVGWILQKKGELPAALEEYRTALTLGPNNPTYRKAYESLSASLSRSTASAAPTALKPQSDIERLNHADLLESKGDLDGAIAEDRELVRISPTYGLAHSHLGSSEERQRR
jgi:tetratricopeptide (TPR) repeat protein